MFVINAASPKQSPAFRVRVRVRVGVGVGVGVGVMAIIGLEFCYF